MAQLRARDYEAELGPNPLLLMRGAFLRLALLGLIVMVAIAVLLLLFPSTALGVFAALLGAVWLYLLVDTASDLLSARRGIGMFRASVRHVRRGAINPLVVVRAESCEGIAVVDTIAQLVMLNGTIWPVAAVTGLQQREDMVEVMLADAQIPVVAISLDSAAEARDAILRLGAALGTGDIAVSNA